MVVKLIKRKKKELVKNLIIGDNFSNLLWNAFSEVKKGMKKEKVKYLLVFIQKYSTYTVARYSLLQLQLLQLSEVSTWQTPRQEFKNQSDVGSIGGL